MKEIIIIGVIILRRLDILTQGVIRTRMAVNAAKKKVRRRKLCKHSLSLTLIISHYVDVYMPTIFKSDSKHLYKISHYIDEIAR